jgi:GNAT superfamily N-acetyltransferase
VLELRAVGYDHPDVAVLVAAVQREYVQRYGDEDATPVEPAEFAPPHGFFTVGYVAGRPVACGGWRARDGRSDQSLRDGDAEVKRMFVRAEHRGRGRGQAARGAGDGDAPARGDRALHERRVRPHGHVRALPALAELPLLREDPATVRVKQRDQLWRTARNRRSMR